jgi:hypothetical protein
MKSPERNGRLQPSSLGASLPFGAVLGDAAIRYMPRDTNLTRRAAASWTGRRVMDLERQRGREAVRTVVAEYVGLLLIQ